MNPERKVKRRTRKLDQSLAGVVYEDTEDSESLPQPTSTMDGDIGSDDGSDMDVGVNTVFVLISAHAPISAHPGQIRKTCTSAHCTNSILLFCTNSVH